MSWRTVIISSQAKLDYKMGYLVVRNDTTKKILIDEIHTLVIENLMVSMTSFLLAVLTEKKVKVIFCDGKHNPLSELIPYHGSHDSAAKIRAQTGWDNETKKLVWREIVAEKIRQQALFLDEVGKERERDLLLGYCSQVEPGDSSNREGHAAKVYFNALFGTEFSRSADCPVNAALNYGYSIILSTFNKEIAANGYLSQIGIFHDNMFNNFNLGCDLMEPFRIIIDRHVYGRHSEVFEKEDKYLLWRLLDEKVLIDSNRQTIGNAIRIYTKSALDAINDRDISKLKRYTLPEEIK